jgi:hypothetical protein
VIWLHASGGTIEGNASELFEKIKVETDGYFPTT